MVELASIFLVIILYLTPLNLIFYNMAEWVTGKILEGNLLESWEGFENIISGGIYIFFIILMISLGGVVVKYLLLYLEETKGENEKKVDIKEILYEYKRGQGYINKISFFCILVILFAHILFRIYDVRIFVLGILSLLFVFTTKRKPEKSYEEDSEMTEILKDDESRTEEIVYSWKYRINPLDKNEFINFRAKIKWSKERYLEYQAMDHSDNSPEFLSRYVLDGKCPEVIDLTNQIKKMCRDNGLNTFHTASVVMSFQQSFRYKQDYDSKGDLEYIRYPLETLVDKEGDCDCHAVCASTILSLMGYSVLLLRIIYENGEGHLAFAIEGAEGLPGEFLEYENKKYYYCEATPSNDKEFIGFTVGIMPDLSDAQVDKIPVKELVSK